MKLDNQWFWSPGLGRHKFPIVVAQWFELMNDQNFHKKIYGYDCILPIVGSNS